MHGAVFTKFMIAILLGFALSGFILLPFVDSCALPSTRINRPMSAVCARGSVTTTVMRYYSVYAAADFRTAARSGSADLCRLDRDSRLLGNRSIFFRRGSRALCAVAASAAGSGRSYS